MSDFEGNDSGSDEEEVLESSKTPVTIVTGFLGSGKTTLVNYILQEQTQWKICVVENEFGEVSIDNDLVLENVKSKEDFIMMDNGCVCCTVRGDLVRTFGALAARRKDFDAIIIETTGLADPAPILFTFSSNALLQDHYRIDSIVCMVDSKHVGQHLDEKRDSGDINEAENQIAFSDRIILNKLDLVTKEELQDLKERISLMNSFAVLIETERSRAPLDKILGLNSFSLENVVAVDPTIMYDDEEEEAHEHSHAHGHCHDDSCGHQHDDSCHSEGCTDSSHKHDHGHEHEHEHGHEHDGCKEGCTDSHHDHVHEDSHGNEHKHGHEHTHDEPPEKKKKKKHNLSLVSSVGYTIRGALDIPLFNQFMSDLLAANAANIYRSKGVLEFEGQGDTKFVFQGVHEQINFGPSEKPWAEGEDRLSKMVFIGKNLEPEVLREKLISCTVNPAAAIVTMHKRAA